MDQINKLLTIDLDRQQIRSEVTVCAKQRDDASREIVATLRNSGVVWDVPPSATLRLRLLKPDNTAVYSALPASTDGKVHITLGGQMLTQAGTAAADIEITDAGAILSSFKFWIRIEPQAVPDGTIESENDFSALQEAIAAVGEIGTATNAANAAAAAANAAAERVEPEIEQLQTEVTQLDSLTGSHSVLLQTLQQWISELDQSKMEKSVVADYIVEQGTSGNWTYRKWNSGIAECWQVYNTGTGWTFSTSAVGGIYSFSIPLPANLFTAIPAVSCGTGSHYHNWCDGASLDGKNVQIRYYQTNTSFSGFNIPISVRAIGRYD